jgi:hypothetical protein
VASFGLWGVSWELRECGMWKRLYLFVNGWVFLEALGVGPGRAVVEDFGLSRCINVRGECDHPCDGGSGMRKVNYN